LRESGGSFMDEEGHTSMVLHADLDCFYAEVLLILLIHLLLDLVAKPLVQLLGFGSIMCIRN
jgi:nucleotidyltransferase/DNA polymerase involved in DNA repair